MRGPVALHTHTCVACGRPVSCQTPECSRGDVTCEPCIERSYEARHGHPARGAYPGYYPLALDRTFASPPAPREASLDDVRDYFGALITPGVRVAYVSPGMRPTLSHGVVLGIEPCRRRFVQSPIQVHVKTYRGTHVRLFDPKRVIVLSGSITKEKSR
jgi:hypothetical protein